MLTHILISLVSHAKAMLCRFGYLFKISMVNDENATKYVSESLNYYFNVLR